MKKRRVITDLAVKTFIFAQQRAIESGKEKITASIIRSVAKDKFKMLQHALKAMKSKDKRSLKYYEDLYPVFKDSAFQTVTISGELANAPEIQAKINNEASGVKEVDTNEIKTPNTSTQTEGKVISFKQNKISRSNSNKPKLADEKSLVNLLQKTQKENQSFYQALLNDNYIRQGNEFFEGGLH